MTKQPERTHAAPLRPSALTLLAVLLVAAAVIVFGWWQRHDPTGRSVLDAERASRLATFKRDGRLPGAPDLADLPGRLAAHGLVLGAPVFIRIFKREFALELWLKRDDRYHRFAVYPICRFSGDLGPKLIEGDGQSPEGFYTIDRTSLNANSRWHRAFNLGFPNAYDRALGRTGSFLMVHGGCSSVGCYAMTNPVIDELWQLVSAALRGGQLAVHAHVFPFRPTEANLAAEAGSPWASFWRKLKAGYDAFEETQIPPRVAVCNHGYEVARLDRDNLAPRKLTQQCAAPQAEQRAMRGG